MKQKVTWEGVQGREKRMEGEDKWIEGSGKTTSFFFFRLLVVITS